MGPKASHNNACRVLVGLGNPGPEYHGTRHNVGFQVIDVLAERCSIPLAGKKFRAVWGSGTYRGERIWLVKPMTYMNRSGEAVAALARYFDVSSSQVLVIHDDLDLPVGRVRVVARSGAGGHRGVASVIQHLGGGDFARIKLGIGRPQHGEAVERYVLQRPYPQERELFEQMVERGAEAAQAVLAEGLERAMNIFNRRDLSK